MEIDDDGYYESSDSLESEEDTDTEDQNRSTALLREQTKLCVQMKAKLQLSKTDFKRVLSTMSELHTGNGVGFKVTLGMCDWLEKEALEAVKFECRQWCAICHAKIRTGLAAQILPVNCIAGSPGTSLQKSQ